MPDLSHHWVNKVRRAVQTGERCPYCSFDPTNSNDFCEKHKPTPDLEKMEDAELTAYLIDSKVLHRYEGLNAWVLELLRRYNHSKEMLGEFISDAVGPGPGPYPDEGDDDE